MSSTEDTVRPMLLYLVVLVLSVPVCFMTVTLLPSSEHYVLREDQTIETLTAVFYLCSFLFALFLLFGPRGEDKVKLLVVVGLVGLLGFLDELSFGNRIFGYTAPKLGACEKVKVEIDAVHDLFECGFLFLSKGLEPLVYLLVASTALLLVGIGLKYRAKIVRAVVTACKYPPYAFLLFCGALALISFVLDLGVPPILLLKVFEEVFEMNAALALLFALYTIGQEGR